MLFSPDDDPFQGIKFVMGECWEGTIRFILVQELTDSALQRFVFDRCFFSSMKKQRSNTKRCKAESVSSWTKINLIVPSQHSPMTNLIPWNGSSSGENSIPPSG